MAFSAWGYPVTGRETPPRFPTCTGKLYVYCPVSAPSPKWSMLFPGVKLRERTRQKDDWQDSVALSHFAVKLLCINLIPLSPPHSSASYKIHHRPNYRSPSLELTDHSLNCVYFTLQPLLLPHPFCTCCRCSQCHF